MNLDDDLPAATGETALEGAAASERNGASSLLRAKVKPNIDHLIFEGDEPVESLLWDQLMRLLVEVLYASWAGPGEGRPFAAFSNVGVFGEPKQTPLVPDVAVSLDVRMPGDYSRRENQSYLLWEFGKPPDVAIEFVSDKRGGERTHKLRGYARLGIRYYAVFDPRLIISDKVLEVFELRDGVYVPTDAAWLPGVGLGLTLWEGEYEGCAWRWLRWCDRDGVVLPTGREAKEQEHQRADAEKQRADQAVLAVQQEKKRAGQEKRRAGQEKRRAEQAAQVAGREKQRAEQAVQVAEQEKQRAKEEKRRAEQEKRRADRLAAKLRELGIDPTDVSA